MGQGTKFTGGIVMGMMVGVVFGITMDNLALGIAFGVAIGIGFAAATRIGAGNGGKDDTGPTE
ncbi:hypothetical protein ACFO4E_27945 [Nocardiopsis mangrovi]|uniref:Glycine zipper family protein n=1 Tax=Nocardiopsis mangrovi TaxID=1179818 RepID=A0ABV9E3E3_9ACTN